MLTGSDKLAHVSKEPGKTKTINHYLINDGWYLVDLPGYGFAKASKGTQGAWLGFTKDYFLERDALVAVLLLVDASIPPQPLDLECADWLAASEVPFAIVFTKADAKKKSGPTPAQNMAAFKKGMLEEWASLPACFATSSKEGKGKGEVLGYLASLRRLDAEAA
ncbi:MAG: P-loop containing nucleoside triphosphate hydrolase protein [Monoraphidium minutum]|nr:MAG: P-loop containing nucleoside triphosphate hydrolase protein [Monoraphidium minutum]